MPELPEVETTRRGLEPRLIGRKVRGAVVREPRLRWPVPTTLGRALGGARVQAVERRAKYLLLRSDRGTAIIHLGMSGHLRVLPATTPAGPHDHLDLLLDDGNALRLRDPRRFGAFLFTRRAPERHPLLRGLGPEPLAGELSGDHLFRRSRRRRAPLRNFLLDGRVVAGVGNIYANEAAFLAGIDPRRPAGRISLDRYRRLVASLERVLTSALAAGGTTLRDFRRVDGEPGYFSLRLWVYGREGKQCRRCRTTIRRAVLGARSIFYCRRCQR